MCLLGMLTALPALAGGSSATVKTNPSPALSNKPLEVTIVTEDLGSEVYCYSWCADINGTSKSPWQWGDVHTDKFRMTGANGTYTISIASIKEFYGLSDNELSGLKKLGFIAKTSSGRQTDDLFVNVEEGTHSVYSGGSGTASDPYILSTPADLQTLAGTTDDWGSESCFRMDADIDASAVNGMIGEMSRPFKGRFDGNGHCIKNFSAQHNTVGEPAGLFGAVDGARITDLGMVAADIAGSTYVGALVGYAASGNIERCFSSGNVRGSSVCVGGLIGENVNATVRDCYSMATVDNSTDYATGGLAGKNSGSITNTYASGDVSGYDYAGGLVGANYGDISNSVALNGKITSASDYAARFGGNNNRRNVSTHNHSWDKIIAGHLVWTSFGDHAQSHEANYLADFKNFKAMTGWDFNNVWEWRTTGKKSYPVLRNLSSQQCTLPTIFYDNISAVDEITGDAGKFITVGPNPTHDVVTVNTTVALQDLRLYNINGAMVSISAGDGVNPVTIDLGTMPAGIYMLTVDDTQGGRSIFKIIKK